MRFGGREYKTPAHLGKEAVARVNTPYSHAFPRCKGCFCSLFEVGGGGARSPAKADSERRESADGFAAKMKRTKAGCRVVKILFPVFGGEKAAAKIRTVKGLRVEIFSRCARKNTTRPLTVRIVGADEIFRLRGEKAAEKIKKLC